MKKTLLLVSILLFGTGLFSAPQTPEIAGVLRNGKWRIIGMGGGGTTYGPKVSYNDDNVAVVRSDMNCSFVTYNGGELWKQFNFGNALSDLCFDKNDPNDIYASNNNLYRSEDKGKSWKILFPDPAKNTYRVHREDHGEQYTYSEDPAFPASMQEVNISTVCVDPSNKNNIYIAFGFDRGLVFGSSDYGRSWKKLLEADCPVLRVWVKPPLNSNKATLYILSEKGIYSGDKLEFIGGPKDEKVLDGSFGVDLKTGKTLFYITCAGSWKDSKYQGGVFVSEDEGKTWSQKAQEIYAQIKNPGKSGTPKFFRLSTSEFNPNTAYVGFESMKLDDSKNAKKDGLYNGIVKTVDGGKTWTILNKECDVMSEKFVETSYVERDTPGSGWNIWFDWPRGIAVSPSNPDVCYFTDCFRVYTTTDGGKTFKQKNSINYGDGRFSTRGIDLTTNYGVHFDPFNKEHLLISYTDMGLFNSYDSGKTFYRMLNGIPRDSWGNTCYWLEFDPDVKDLIFSAWSYTHDLPMVKMSRNSKNMLPNQAGGAAISSDGGKSWTVSNKGMEETPLTHILLDPKSPIGKRTVYATGFGKGVYKSVDNGKSWKLKNKGIEGENPLALRLARSKEGVLYLCVYRKGAEGYYGPAYNGGIYRSIDGAENWEKLGLPPGVNGPRSLTVDPKDSNILYVSAWGICHAGTYLPDTGGGVFMSTDAGKSWANIFKEGQHCNSLTVHPDNSKILFVTGMDNEVYRTDDQGKNWYRLPGFTYKQPTRVTVDPYNHDMIYVNSFGSSVWYGPAKGDPEAGEDIVNRPALFPLNKLGY